MLPSPTRPPQSDAERRKRREEELLALLVLLSARLDAYARQYMRGQLTQERLLFWCMAVIRQSHYQAAQLGVQAAGASAYNPYPVANRAATAQESFLTGFTHDLAAGRYDPQSAGGQGAAARKARFRLYGMRLGGTYWAAWLAALSPQTEVLWTLGDAEHCETCLSEASKGWRKPSQMTRVPRDGTTECLVMCKCSLQTRASIGS